MVAIDDASPNDKREFASYLVSDTVKRITGRHVDDGDRTPPGFTPRTNFFSGALAPESDEEDSKMDEEVESRMSPSSLGLIGRVTDTGDNTTVSIQINLSFALYYRVLPTINERVEANEKAPTVYRKCRVGRLGEELDADDQAEQFAVKTTVTFDARSDDTGLKEQISTEVETELNRQISAIIEDRIKTDPLLFEGDVEAIDGFLSAREDLSDEELIQELADAAIGGDSDYIPEPEIGVEVRLLEGLDETAATVAKPGSALVRVDILNESDAEKDFEEVDLATYETQLELRGTDGTEFQAVTFEDVPSGFRYESSVPGQGHNCTAEWIFDDQDNPVGIKSVTVPVYEQDSVDHIERLTITSNRR